MSDGRNGFYFQQGSAIEQARDIYAKGMRVPDFFEVVADRFLNEDGRKNREIQTSDGIVYHPDGRLKIVRDLGFLDYLATVRKPAINSSGQLELTHELYERIRAPETTKEELRERGLINRLLTEEQAINHPMFLMLARDERLWEVYVRDLYRDSRRYSQKEPHMVFGLGSKPKDRPAWMPIDIGPHGTGGASGGFGSMLDISGVDSRGIPYGGLFVGTSNEKARSDLIRVNQILDGDRERFYVSPIAA